MFAASSLFTPFFLGAIAGAIASGRVGAGIDDEIIWLSPTSILGGLLATGTCSFLAAVFLTEEAERLGDSELTEDLRKKSLISGSITGVISLLGVAVLASDAPTLFDGLIGRGAPEILIAALAGSFTMVMLAQGYTRRARFAAVVAVATVVLGWGFAQYPWLLVDNVTIAEGAGHPATLTALLIAAAIAAVVVTPALVLLFRLVDTDQLGHE